MVILIILSIIVTMFVIAYIVIDTLDKKTKVEVKEVEHTTYDWSMRPEKN